LSVPKIRIVTWLSSCAALALSFAAGCIVVQPLEDYPSEAKGGSRNQGGNSNAGGDDTAGSSSGKGGGQNVAGGSFDDCKTNADCEADSGGQPYQCDQSSHVCTKLKTEVCPLVIGSENVFDPNAIVLGGFAPLTNTNVARNPVVYAHQLALEELSGDNIGGLPDGPDGARRPLVMVVCYNQDERVLEALDHLIDTLHVPAISATLKPGDLRRAYEDHADDDVFFLSPVSVTESVATLDDHDKVWNMLGQPADYVSTYAALLPRVEAQARRVHELADQTPTKLAMVTTPDAFDSELANKLAAALRFNHKSITENQKAKNYQLVSLASTDPVGIAAQVDQMTKFRPHVIVSAASEVVTMVEGVIDQVEARWDDLGSADGQSRPLYILSPFNAGDLKHVVMQLGSFSKFEGSETINELFTGVSIAGPEDTSAQFDYQARLGAKFGDVFSDTANYYDATYLLAYAIYAAGVDEPLTGSRIAQGMQRLITGETMAIGPEQILDTFAALSAGDSLELQSTLGPPSFDAESGVRQIDGSVFCFNISGEEITVSQDTYRFDRALGELRKPKFADPFCITDFFEP
jgi:hypothetical protein